MNESGVKRVAYSMGPSSTVTGMALWAHATYGDVAAVTPGLLGVAAATLAYKTDKAAVWVAAGALGLGATVSHFGWDTASAIAWAVATGASLAGRLWFEHTTAETQLVRLAKRQEIRTAAERHELALAKLGARSEATAKPEWAELPPTDRAIRETFWAVYRKDLLGVEVDPTRGGWRATIHTPPALARDKVIREWPTKIQNGLGLGGRYAVEPGVVDNQLVVSYTEEDLLADTIPYEPEDNDNIESSLYIGLNEDGNEVLVNLLGRHVLVLGTSGNGKSNLVNYIILRIVRAGGVAIGIDMKKGVELAPVRPLLATLASTPEAAREVFDWLETETDRRADLMISEGVRKWSEDLGPYIWVFTDELSELTQKRYNVEGLPKLPELLESGLRIDRAFGIHFVGATQAPSSNAFGGSTDGRANYKIRTSTRLDQAAHAQFGFGPSWKSKGWDPNGKLLGPGEYLISSEDHLKPIRCKTPYISDRELELDTERLVPFVTKLENSPWGEGGVSLTPSQQVRKFLRHRGEVTRTDIEQGTGLDKKQVLKALTRLGDEVDKTPASGQEPGTYWLAPDGAVERLLGGTLPA